MNRAGVLLAALAALSGCGAPDTPVAAPASGAVPIQTRPTPLNWRPLDPAGTQACAIAREAVSGDAGFTAAVATAITAAAQQSDRAGVRWHGEILGRKAGSAPDSTYDPFRTLEFAIKSYYAECAGGTWSTPNPRP